MTLRRRCLNVACPLGCSNELRCPNIYGKYGYSFYLKIHCTLGEVQVGVRDNTDILVYIVTVFLQVSRYMTTAHILEDILLPLFVKRTPLLIML